MGDLVPRILKYLRLCKELLRGSGYINSSPHSNLADEPLRSALPSAAFDRQFAILFLRHLRDAASKNNLAENIGVMGICQQQDLSCQPTNRCDNLQT